MYTIVEGREDGKSCSLVEVWVLDGFFLVPFVSKSDVEMICRYQVGYFKLGRFSSSMGGHGVLCSLNQSAMALYLMLTKFIKPIFDF